MELLKEITKYSDKIDIFELTKKLRTDDYDCLSKYLKEIYKVRLKQISLNQDLAKRSDQKNKGINRETFSKVI